MTCIDLQLIEAVEVSIQKWEALYRASREILAECEKTAASVSLSSLFLSIIHPFRYRGIPLSILPGECPLCYLYTNAEQSTCKDCPLPSTLGTTCNDGFWGRWNAHPSTFTARPFLLALYRLRHRLRRTHENT